MENLFINKAKPILKKVSNELEELRNLAIDEIVTKLLKSKKANEYYKLNNNKYDLIVKVYGSVEADAIIMEQIYVLLDDFYSEIPLESSISKKSDWIGEFKLPELPNVRFSNEKHRELFNRFEYENLSTYEPYRDNDVFQSKLDMIIKTEYLGIYYEGGNFFSHFFMDDYGLYEIVVESTYKGLCINSIIIRRDDDYLIEED